jgi:hypothetical protein
MKLKWMTGMVGVSLLSLSLGAQTAKHVLLPNMVHIYSAIPDTAENIQEIFTKGEWYGRLRTHLFVDNWAHELQKNGKDIRKDSSIVGIGGSLSYKSAYYHGFGATAGLYFTQGIGSLGRDRTYLYKAGKDTLNRYNRLTKGKSYIATFAEAYLEYRYSHTDVKAGRQIFESFLTKSNDGKMIPNTFQGVTVVSHDLKDTTLKAAYFTRQKLRDHSKFHHVLATGYVKGVPYSYYTQNDDAGMHRGLTLAKLKAKGIDDRLIVLEAKNSSIDKLLVTANYTAVPDLLSYAMVQADYTFKSGNWTLRPGLRYMQQFDNGAGAIGGASKKLLIEGYKDPKSLDSWLFGARLDAKVDAWKFRVAYTQVADKADIIAPWRGFPTGGFTRLMGQYNWDANTRTYVFKAGYDFRSYDTKVVGSFGYQDFDDAKAAVSADDKVAVLEVMQGFDRKQHFYWKARYAHVWGDEHTPLPGSVGKYKLDPSYDELRFEVDYLF